MSITDDLIQTAIDSDGFVYDVTTGEVLGLAEVEDTYAIDSPEKADWALEIRSKIEADILAIDARLKAVTAQLQALRREKERRLAWWDFRFSTNLIEFARSCLSGKSRTARFGWGSVSFRKTKGSTQIIDMQAAVEYVRTFAPTEVRRVETVTVKGVMEAREAAIEATGEDEPLPFIVSSSESENVHIETGIYLERKSS